LKGQRPVQKGQRDRRKQKSALPGKHNKGSIGGGRQSREDTGVYPSRMKGRKTKNLLEGKLSTATATKVTRTEHSQVQEMNRHQKRKDPSTKNPGEKRPY